MGKIVVATYLSVDGVMEEPAWTMPYWNDELSKFQADVNYASDALLLGRVTYEGFAAAWPSMKDEGGNRMNSMPKYVATTSVSIGQGQTTLYGTHVSFSNLFVWSGFR